MMVLDKIPRGNTLLSIALPLFIMLPPFMVGFIVRHSPILSITVFLSPFLIGLLSVIVYGVIEKFSLAGLFGRSFFAFILFLSLALILVFSWPFEFGSDEGLSRHQLVYLLIVTGWYFIPVSLVYALSLMIFGNFVGIVLSGLLKR